MDRTTAKELLHLRDWLVLVRQIVDDGEAECLANPLSQEAGDSLMMTIGELSRRLSDAGIAPPEGVAWSDAIANRNWVIHQYDEIDREVTWNTLSTSVIEWGILFESLIEEADTVIAKAREG
jgi:uncharacterized protein with HEPN domain